MQIRQWFLAINTFFFRLKTKSAAGGVSRQNELPVRLSAMLSVLLAPAHRQLEPQNFPKKIIRRNEYEDRSPTPPVAPRRCSLEHGTRF